MRSANWLYASSGWRGCSRPPATPSPSRPASRAPAGGCSPPSSPSRARCQIAWCAEPRARERPASRRPPGARWAGRLRGQPRPPPREARLPTADGRRALQEIQAAQRAWANAGRADRPPDARQRQRGARSRHPDPRTEGLEVERGRRAEHLGAVRLGRGEQTRHVGRSGGWKPAPPAGSPAARTKRSWPGVVMFRRRASSSPATANACDMPAGMWKNPPTPIRAAARPRPGRRPRRRARRSSPRPPGGRGAASRCRRGASSSTIAYRSAGLPAGHEDADGRRRTRAARARASATMTGDGWVVSGVHAISLPRPIRRKHPSWGVPRRRAPGDASRTRPGGRLSPPWPPSKSRALGTCRSREMALTGLEARRVRDRLLI